MSLGLFPGMSAPKDEEVMSDVAGSLGFKAYYNNKWFRGVWVPSQADQSIAYKELFAMGVASHVWDSQRFHQHVLFQSDKGCCTHLDCIDVEGPMHYAQHNFTQFQLLLNSWCS